jgi:hypothetical protein
MTLHGAVFAGALLSAFTDGAGGTPGDPGSRAAIERVIALTAVCR